MSKKPSTGLTKKHWVGYALGDMGGCMTFALMGSMVTRYYTNVLHVDTVVLAVLLAVWNIWDAVNDPMMGALMDKMFAKKQHPQGKFRPWLLRATPLLAVSAICLWTVPTFCDGIALIVVLFSCKILYEASYTMFNIPMGSLLSAMADTDEERASLSSARGFGGTVGNLIPMILFPILLGIFGDSNAMGYGVGAAVCALIGMVMCFFHYKWTEERNIVETKPEDAENIKFTDILGVFKKNRAFLALCIHGVCVCTNQYVGQTLGTYMYADVLGSLALMSVGSMVGMPVSLVCMSVVPKIARRIGSQKVLRNSLLIGCALYVGLFTLHITTNIHVWVHIGINALAAGVSGLSNMMQWGMLSEAIEYNEYLTGKRTEGSINGTFNMLRRLGQGLGASFGVAMLGMIGYNAEVTVQTADTILGIKVLCLLFPAICAIGSWIVFRFVWNITPELKEKMAQKRAAM